MKKDNLHGGVYGWVIMEPLTGRFFHGFGEHSNSWLASYRPDGASPCLTRKQAVEIAKRLGKGRKMTVAKMTVTYYISYQGATEVTGEDASRI